MCIGLYVNYVIPLRFQLTFSGHNFEKSSKVHENLYNGSRVAHADRERLPDRHDEANSSLSQFCKLA